MPVVTFTGKADGDTLIAAPAAGCRIRILGGELSSAAAINLVSLKSNTTVIWQTERMKATPFSADLNVDGARDLFTAPGQALVLGASGGTVSGNIDYTVIGMENQQLSVS
jgi:hypothetical protein